MAMLDDRVAFLTAAVCCVDIDAETAARTAADVFVDGGFTVI